MRDEDEEMLKLRFGTKRDEKTLWQQERDREDAYWCSPVFVCTRCGAEETKNPSGYEYDEFVCEGCEDLENAEAEEYLKRMMQVGREGT